MDEKKRMQIIAENITYLENNVASPKRSWLKKLEYSKYYDRLYEVKKRSFFWCYPKIS